MSYDVLIRVTLRLRVDDTGRACVPLPSESELVAACAGRCSAIRWLVVRGQRVAVSVDQVRRTSVGGDRWRA